MNMQIKIFYIICLSVVITSCCIARSPIPTLYILPTSIHKQTSVNINDTNITGPIIVMDFVTIPDYLNQPQIVTRKPGTVFIKVEEYHRWSEPLAEGCKRILQQTISNSLEKIDGVVVDNNLTRQQNWTLRINIIRLDGYPNSTVTLDAIWTLTYTTGKSKVGRFTHSSATGSTIADMVTTQGLLLEELGTTIGKEIHQQLPYELVKQ